MSRKRETLFSYFGGKYRQLGNILPILEKIPRKFYIEPFGGSGLVLYNKPVDDYEIYNDISGELCNLFRVLRTNSSELEDLASITPNSARFFEEFVSIRRAFGNDELLGKLQKKYQFAGYDLPTISAFATFYCLNTSFGGQG